MSLHADACNPGTCIHCLCDGDFSRDVAAQLEAPTATESTTMSDDDIATMVRNSSPELLAHLLITERTARADDHQAHAAEVASLRTTLDRAQRIGINVMRRAAQGRKTIRVTDVMEPANE